MKEPKSKYKTAHKLELKEIKKEFPKVFKKICCPACDEEIAADNINITKSVAKCGGCNAIFSIEEDLTLLTEEAEKTLPKKHTAKQEFFRPEGIELFHFKDDLDITVQQPYHWVDLVGVIFLPLFAFIVGLGFMKGTLSMSPLLAMILGSLFFVYRIWSYPKYKTFIDINEEYLSVKSRPKNFKKDQTFRSADINQLYIKKAADGTETYSIFLIINGLSGQYNKHLVTVNSISKAKYLEQEIEKYLNIEDRPVPEANVL